MAGKKRAKIIVVAVFAGALFLFFISPLTTFSQTQEELELELKKIEQQIADYEKELTKTKSEKKSLANKIYQLKNEQKKIALQIKSTNLQIDKLAQDLFSLETSIQETSQKLEQSREHVAVILQAIYEQGRKSFFQTLLEKGISAFLAQIKTLAQLSRDLTVTANQAKAMKEDLESQQINLETKQKEKENFLAIQALQYNDLQGKTNQQNKLLKDTQGKEANYQEILIDSKKRAQEIRSRIYELLGIDTQITFGKAVEVAQWVSKQTNVRPAFLLAVLAQESNLGKNVGTCNRLGDPPSKSWKEIMKPDRDQEPFLTITKELGMNPDITPVSCPMRDAKGNRIGWGGAMGPAQFIPSTWMSYKNKVSAFTGKSPANPWDIRDAFVAAAILLKANGAVAGNENSEWQAAMRYFSGSTNPKFSFYGDSVITLTKQYEEELDILD